MFGRCAIVEDVISYLVYSGAGRPLGGYGPFCLELVPFTKRIPRNFVSYCILYGDEVSDERGSLMPCSGESQALIYSKIIFSFNCEVPILYQLLTFISVTNIAALLKALICLPL